MNKVTVVGSFMYDLVATAPRRPKTGETLVGDSFGMFLGGKGANQAIAASRAGATVSMVGRLGNDVFGDQFLEKFSEEGIDTDFVIQDTKNGTGVGMPLIDADGDNSIVIIPQANMALSVENIDEAESSIADSDVLVLQCEVPMEANQRAAAIAKENNTIIILNPAPARKIPNALLSLVDIITPNESETEILTDMPTETDNQIVEAAHLLLSKGIETVILTLGGRGSFLLTEKMEKLIQAYSVEVVDTTAAGDAFCGALAASLAKGKGIDASVLIANAAGALAVTKLGAEPSIPTKEELDQLLAN
ncbi:MAG: ribokinase [Candidatus Marinimicrobia bacterium]|nr:ribokinase [Candidatus Neomarinimicrobiota bacterium]